MDIFSGIASIFGGGLTGLVGSVTQRIFEYKSKKLDIELQKEKFANDIALKRVDAELMAQEWAARTKVADVEATAKMDVADSEAFATALTSEPQRYSDVTHLTDKQNWLMVLLDFMRGAIRPGLTIYLCALTTAIYFQAKFLLRSNDITVEQAYDLVTQIIDTILYLTTTCVLFWFGTRNKAKQK